MPEDDKPDIAQLARDAADAVGRLAVEVGHVIMEGVRTAWDAARTAAEQSSHDDDSGSESES